MIKTYVEIGGSPVGIEDESIEDFILDTELTRSIYEQEGSGVGELRRHADELRTISTELENRIDWKGEGYLDIWPNLVGLALKNGNAGLPFLRSYGYIRLNRLLDVDFGPDETPTTDILRSIGLEKIDRSICGRSTSYITEFFDTYFSRVMTDSYFAYEGNRLNPKLDRHVSELITCPDINNPALARVLSIVMERACTVDFEIEDNVYREILTANRDIFRNESNTRTNKVGGAEKSEEEEQTPQTEVIDESEESHEANAEDNKEAEVLLVEKLLPNFEFDATRAACRTKKEDFKNPELLVAARKYIIRLMFPERGASTKEAKALCNSCTIKDDCLYFALDRKIKFGIWGGESERTRRKMRKENDITDEDEDDI